MNSFTSFVFLSFLISATTSLCGGTRPGSSGSSFSAEFYTNSNNNQLSKTKQHNKGGGGGGGGSGSGSGSGYVPGMGGYFGPGSGFDIPGFGSGNGNGIGNGIIGGGYGGGYGGPSGGSSRNGIVRPTVVCKEKGPCYMKKLTCPKKCFTSYSRAGKGYGGGGGGGGCTMDCKKNCVAYC